MHITVEIPIKGYLKKFIAKDHEVEPFKISLGKCHFSSIILDPIKRDYSKFHLLEKEGKYEMMKILVPFPEKKFTVDQETVLRINQRLKEMFDQQLSHMVTMCNERKGDIYNQVQRFVDFYGITDDDLDFYTVVKMYYRRRHPSESKRMIKEEMERYQQLALFDAPTGSVRSVPGY
jgi:hypothetical protein